VVEKEDAIANDRSVETGRYRVEAEATMADIQSRNHDNKAINLILEFSIGKVNKVIDDMVRLARRLIVSWLTGRQINLYEPAILVVGTRGKSLGGFQGLLPGSVSKYCLQHSPVPVIVVRPTSKRDKAKSKRTNDPDRQGYREILAKSEKLPDIDSPRNSFFENEDEAATIGGAATAPKPPNAHKPSVDTHPLAQVEHAESSDDDPDTGTSTLIGDDLRSPLPLMKSPHLQNLDSPDLSSQSSSEDEEDQGGVSTGVNDAVRGAAKMSVGGADPRKSSMSYVDSLLNSSSPAISPKSEQPPALQKRPEGT
jgi:hypothetical protein